MPAVQSEAELHAAMVEAARRRDVVGLVQISILMRQHYPNTTDSMVFMRLVEEGEAQAMAEETTPNPLTPTEVRLLELAATGRTNKEIAERMHLSPETVKTYLYRISKKMKLRENNIRASRFAAVRTARLNGWINDKQDVVS